MPRSAWSSPAMMFSKVDFPQPLGPTRQTNSPSAMRSDTSSRAWTCKDLVWNHFDTCSSTSLAACDWAGGCSEVTMSIDLFDEPREVRRGPDKTGALRVRYEMSVFVQGEFIGEHDALPRLRNQIRRHVGFGFSGQFLPDHLLRLFRLSDNPFLQFTMSADEFFRQVALVFEKFDTRHQDGNAVLRLFDEHFSSRIP